MTLFALPCTMKQTTQLALVCAKYEKCLAAVCWPERHGRASEVAYGSKSCAGPLCAHSRTNNNAIWILKSYSLLTSNLVWSCNSMSYNFHSFTSDDLYSSYLSALLGRCFPLTLGYLLIVTQAVPGHFALPLLSSHLSTTIL